MLLPRLIQGHALIQDISCAPIGKKCPAYIIWDRYEALLFVLSHQSHVLFKLLLLETWRDGSLLCLLSQPGGLGRQVDARALFHPAFSLMWYAVLSKENAQAGSILSLLLLRDPVPPNLFPKLEICAHVNKSYLDTKSFCFCLKRRKWDSRNRE